MTKKLLVSILFMSISYLGLSQSKIEKAEESLKKQKSSIKTDSISINENNDSLGETLVKETVGRLFVNIFAYTAYGLLVETPFEKDSPSSNAILTKHPYFNSNNGNYGYDWDDNSAVGRTTISSRYIFENSRINGNHFNVGMRFYNKIALELDYLQLWENNHNFGHHTLAIYTALAKYHRVRTKKVDAWWGAGATYVDGNVDNFGFTIGLGTQVFLEKPISLESNFNHTLINNSSLSKFNGLINYYMKQYKINAGYEYLDIGNQSFSTFSLGLGVSF